VCVCVVIFIITKIPFYYLMMVITIPDKTLFWPK
jgi:hypothetical protein